MITESEDVEGKVHTIYTWLAASIQGFLLNLIEELLQFSLSYKLRDTWYMAK